MNCLKEIKDRFKETLFKGRILEIYELFPPDSHDDALSEILQRWYANVVEGEFISSLPQDVEEIALHSPTQIHIKSRNEETTTETDLLQADFEIFFEVLAIRNNLNWNIKYPFASFFSEMNNSPVRITLIHGSTNHLNQSKAFIRFLNNEIIPLDYYTTTPEFIKELVTTKKNILVSGATGSGKTTFLNTLVSQVPDHEHLTIIEDTHELYCHSPRVTRFLSSEELSQFSQLSYLKYALRITPDRIILGEIRGEEAESLVLAMNSGHKGVLTSLHANSAKDTIDKLALLLQLYGKNSFDYELAQRLIANNIDYIIFIKQKRISEIIQVYGSSDGRTLFDEVQIES